MEAILFSTIFTAALGYPYYRITRPRPEPIYDDHEPTSREIRESPEYRAWRIAVLKRDKFKCQWCEATTDLEVDHIYPLAYFPELALEVTNGRVLCNFHHKQTFTYGSKGKNYKEIWEQIRNIQR